MTSSVAIKQTSAIMCELEVFAESDAESSQEEHNEWNPDRAGALGLQCPLALDSAILRSSSFRWSGELLDSGERALRTQA